MPDYRAIAGPAHIHPFAAAVAGDDLIFITGTAFPADSAREQVRGTFAEVERLLAEVGSSLGEVLYYRPIISDRKYLDEVNEAMAEAIPEPRPACGALIIAGLVHPSLMFEIEVIAQRGARIVLDT